MMVAYYHLNREERSLKFA